MSGTWTLPEDIVVPTFPSDYPEAGTEIPQHWDKCFGCGDEQPIGLGMRFRTTDTLEVVGRFDVAKHYQGGPGLIHGGLLTTAFDEAQGMACFPLRTQVVTGHLQVDFAKPIPLGAVLELRARIDGVQRRKVYTSAEARIVDGSGADPNVVVGSSRGLFIRVDVEHFADTMRFADGRPSSGHLAAF